MSFYTFILHSIEWQIHNILISELFLSEVTLKVVQSLRDGQWRNQDLLCSLLEPSFVGYHLRQGSHLRSIFPAREKLANVKPNQAHVGLEPRGEKFVLIGKSIYRYRSSNFKEFFPLMETPEQKRREICLDWKIYLNFKEFCPLTETPNSDPSTRSTKLSKEKEKKKIQLIPNIWDMRRKAEPRNENYGNKLQFSHISILTYGRKLSTKTKRK